jgi:transposase
MCAVKDPDPGTIISVFVYVNFNILELCAVGIKVFGFSGGGVKKSTVFIDAALLETVVFGLL